MASMEALLWENIASNKNIYLVYLQVIPDIFLENKFFSLHK